MQKDVYLYSITIRHCHGSYQNTLIKLLLSAHEICIWLQYCSLLWQTYLQGSATPNYIVL